MSQRNFSMNTEIALSMVAQQLHVQIRAAAPALSLFNVIDTTYAFYHCRDGASHRFSRSDSYQEFSVNLHHLAILIVDFEDPKLMKIPQNYYRSTVL